MDYAGKKAWENRLIRRDGIIFSIMLTALMALNLAQSSFDSIVGIVTNGVPFVLQLLLCIGAWLSAFRILTGAKIVRVILTIYRVMMYVAGGALILLMMYAFYVMFKYQLRFEAIIVMLLIFAAIIAVVFFWAALYKNAVIIVREIISRLISERKYVDMRVCASSLPAMLMTLAVFYCVILVANLLISYTGAGIIGYLLDELNYSMYMLGDLGYSITAIGSASDGGINCVQYIINIFICFYGFFYGRSFKKLSLS